MYRKKQLSLWNNPCSDGSYSESNKKHNPTTVGTENVVKPVKGHCELSDFAILDETSQHLKYQNQCSYFD